jgi:DNA-binding CsgD family transcriptional regulator
MIVEKGAAGYPTLDGLPSEEGAIRQMTDPPLRDVEPLAKGSGRRGPDGADYVAGESNRRLRLILAIALTSIVIGGTADLVMDSPASWLSFHVVFETLMIAGALLMATTLWVGWWRSEHAAAALRASLERQSAERDRWRASAQQALEGLGHAIDAQFTQWHLTPTERAIALLVLKGHGHKQIAALTGRSERTVRQHAGVVYEKAGLSGRAELSAFFLQDLMLPEEQRSTFPVTASEESAARSSQSLTQAGA